jgi:hypothetical protein
MPYNYWSKHSVRKTGILMPLFNTRPLINFSVYYIRIYNNKYRALPEFLGAFPALRAGNRAFRGFGRAAAQGRRGCSPLRGGTPTIPLRVASADALA